MVRRKSTSRSKSTTRIPIDKVKLAYAWKRAKNKSEANASTDTKVRALRTPGGKHHKRKHTKKNDTSDSDDIFKQ